MNFRERIVKEISGICRENNESVIHWLEQHEHKNSALLHNELLVTASLNGRVEIVEFLLDLGIASPTYTFSAAVRCSIVRGHDRILGLHLQHEKFCEVRSSYLQKAIHLAAEKGHAAVLKLLADDGRIDLFDSDILNPLLRATWHNQITVVELFVNNQKPAYPYIAYLEALNYACKNKNAVISCMLLDKINFSPKDLINTYNITKDMITFHNYFNDADYATIINRLIELVNK